MAAKSIAPLNADHNDNPTCILIGKFNTLTLNEPVFYCQCCIAGTF
ncbi:hypothetical protein SAMN05216490_0893 [Mucilaginibacter mallensis]|uniref:Uncharacterized protein n=1 Tax=Mucilaginibacter mallensis TaxID=652787 RepID=A0A1H1R0U4_MUCMA|nr:hypothetical protein SAMN05216490_0893 [Mucilaginibacter mallensis]